MKSPRIPHLLLAAATLVAASSASAAITPVAAWHFGETGSGGNTPSDYIGTDHLSGPGATPIVDTTKFASAPGVTGDASLRYNGAASNGNVNYNTVNFANVAAATQNWVLDLWVNPTDLTGTRTVAQLGSGATASWIGIANGQWTFASVSGSNGFGGTGSVTLDASVAATSGAWTALSWVNDGGINYFYVNGVLLNEGGNAATIVNNGSFSIGGKAGNGQNYAGNIDEMRFSTFAPGSFNAATDLMGAAPVPEPSTYGLIGAGALAAVAMVRRRRKHAGQA